MSDENAYRNLLEKNIEEIKTDVKEIRRDIDFIKAYRNQILGGAIMLSFIVNVIFFVASIFFK